MILDQDGFTVEIEGVKWTGAKDEETRFEATAPHHCKVGTHKTTGSVYVKGKFLIVYEHGVLTKNKEDVLKNDVVHKLRHGERTNLCGGLYVYVR